MLYDSLIKNLISEALFAHRDVIFRGVPDDIYDAFSDGVKTVFLMPSAFSYGGEDDFCDIKSYPSSFDIMKRANTLFADVRFMADESFRRSLTENGFLRIAVMAAECACIAEYGYRQAYSWVGEYRAERKDFVQVAAFVSPCFHRTEEICLPLGITDVYITGYEGSPDFSLFEATGPAAKFYAAAAEAEKYAFDRTVIYFNSRQEARAFRAFLAKRETPALLLDGTLTKNERYAVLTELMLGKTNILIATKSYASSSFFCPAQRVIFCGVPFSVSHLYRCSCACKRSIPKIIYCDGDFTRNEKIISSLEEVFGNASVSAERLEELNNIKNMLKGN